MKVMIATLCFCLLAGNAIADDRPDRKLVLDYFQTARIEQSMHTTIDSMVESMMPNADEKEKCAYRELMESTLGWDASKEQLVTIASELYTKQELKAAIAYMKTKAGASMVAKNEAFSKLYAEQMAANFQKFMSSHTAPPAAPTEKAPH